MKNPIAISLFFSFLFFTACQSDEARQKAFAGTYEVTIEAPEAERDLEKAKEEMQEEIEKAQDEIREEMAKASRDIELEFGEDNSFGKALGEFVEGVGELAAGMTELGESLGEMGINLGSTLLRDVRFTAEFEQDGDLEFGRKRGRIRFSGDDKKWKIKNGDMLIWDADHETEEEADVFEIKKISDDEWDLVGDEVTFHLVKKQE